MKALRVLILEDDSTLLAAMGEALKRAGHSVTMVSKPDEARAQLNSGVFNWLFVDCLLPQISGVEFSQQVRKTYTSEQLSIVLMSGIYTDKKFIKESLDLVDAIHFLQKPFDIAEAINLLKSVEEPLVEMSPRQELYALLARTKVTDRQKRKALEKVEQIHGFDLPYVYSLLVDGRMTGHLNIVDEEGKVSGISFCSGAIVGVDVQDKETYLGKLLIESGYITQEELEVALADNTPRKMGQRLIQENLVSPHAFNEILAQQMNIRLSRTIVPQPIKLNFVASEVEDSFPKIEVEDYFIFLHDWVTSKISENWLENHYRSWGSSILKPHAKLSIDSPLLNTPLLRKIPQLLKLISGRKTLDEVVESSGVDSGLFHKVVHLLFICGMIGFTEQVSELNQQKRATRLKSLNEGMKTKNYFEVFEMMGGQRNFVKDELESVYQEFLKVLGDSPAASADPGEIQIWQELNKKVQDTYNLLSDEAKCKAYQQSLEQGELEMKFTSQRKFEEGQAQVKASQFQKALETFKEVKKLSGDKEGLMLYIIWAKLGLHESSTQPEELIRGVERDLLQVPPEEKHLPLSSFVSGLYNKALGDLVGAKREFSKAAAMDPNLLQARRELHLLTIQAPQKPKDFLKRDLKDLVGALFKRKDSA